MRVFVPILIWQLCLIVDSEGVLISSGCRLMLNGFVHRWCGSIESKVNEGLILQNCVLLLLTLDDIQQDVSANSRGMARAKNLLLLVHHVSWKTECLLAILG